MIAYIFLAAFPILLSFFFRDFENQKSKKKFMIICGICLFIFFAFRSRYVGSTDTANYYNMLKRAIGAENWESFFSPDGVETGFQAFTYLLSRITDEPQMIIIASSAIIVFSACFFIYRNSIDPAMSVVLFVTLGLLDFEFQGMRQSIAMSICILSYEFVKNKKLIPFVLMVLLATTFHRTAIVFLAVYLISYLSFDWKGAGITAIVVAIVFVFSERIVTVANDIFESDYTMTVSSGGYVATAVYVIIILYAVFVNTKLPNSGFEALAFYFTLVGAATYAIRYFGALASERISYYFIFGQLILLPSTIACMNKRDQIVVKIIVYILAVALFIYRTNGSSLDPYKFFWQ